MGQSLPGAPRRQTEGTAWWRRKTQEQQCHKSVWPLLRTRAGKRDFLEAGYLDGFGGINRSFLGGEGSGGGQCQKWKEHIESTGKGHGKFGEQRVLEKQRERVAREVH